MDIGKDVIGIWKIAMNVRNNGACVPNVTTDISMCISLKFGLKAELATAIQKCRNTH